MRFIQLEIAVYPVSYTNAAGVEGQRHISGPATRIFRFDGLFPVSLWEACHFLDNVAAYTFMSEGVDSVSTPFIVIVMVEVYGASDDSRYTVFRHGSALSDPARHAGSPCEIYLSLFLTPLGSESLLEDALGTVLCCAVPKNDKVVGFSAQIRGVEAKFISRHAISLS